MNRQEKIFNITLLLILSVFFAFSPNSSPETAGMGFVGMIVFLVMDIIQILKLIKENEKRK